MKNKIANKKIRFEKYNIRKNKGITLIAFAISRKCVRY